MTVSLFFFREMRTMLLVYVMRPFVITIQYYFSVHQRNGVRSWQISLPVNFIIYTTQLRVSYWWKWKPLYSVHFLKSNVNDYINKACFPSIIASTSPLDTPLQNYALLILIIDNAQVNLQIFTVLDLYSTYQDSSSGVHRLWEVSLKPLIYI